MAGSPMERPAKKPPSPKVFNCSNCGASLTIHALGHTVNVACQSCGAVIDVTNENYRILSMAEKKVRIKPAIPLGRRGRLRGNTWEVIGFMVRSDQSGHYSWREYLLFNPFHGFRWLTENNGHWNFVTMIKERPSSVLENAAVFRGESYRLYDKGRAKVSYVLGEFYWRVKVGDTVSGEDYIRPPLMLSCEKDEKEIVWSLAEYMEHGEIRAAFGIQEDILIPSGVGPNQLSPYERPAQQLLKIGLFFLIVLGFIQLFTVANMPDKRVYSAEFVYRKEDPEKVKVTPSFDLPGKMSNAEVRLESAVDNAWLSLDCSLVNEKTGRVYEFEEGVEFYSGHDSDGYWSEGSTSARKVLSRVPGGRYRLNFQVAAPPELAAKDFRIEVRRGVTTWSNFLWALVLLSLMPAYYWIQKHFFEVSRWSNSDYSPYESSDDD